MGYGGVWWDIVGVVVGGWCWVVGGGCGWWVVGGGWWVVGGGWWSFVVVLRAVWRRCNS